MNLSSVSQQLLYSTLRLEADKAHGTEAGTGFIFALHHDGQDYLFVVTNKHVVEGARTGRMFFTRAQEGQPRPRIGERYDLTISDFSRAWTGHPDSQIDVAAMPLVPLLQHINDQGVAVFFKSIPSSMVPTDTVLQELDALEEVVFVGYPNGIYDRRNLLPIMRRGTTATPVYVDYEGAPTFLIDASVFPGSSGSPVLIVNEGSYRAQSGMVIGSRVLFLGIIASVAIRHERGTIELMDIPTAHAHVVMTQQMIDLGVAFKYSAVIETCMTILGNMGVPANGA